MTNNKSDIENIKVAAVVVTYNRLKLLKDCISSLKSQTRKLDVIIIINNDSTDGTSDWLAAQADVIVVSQSNSGSAGGQHTGIKKAYDLGCSLIWCMDDDCKTELNCLEFLLESYLNSENVFALAPLPLNKDGKILFHHRGYFNNHSIKRLFLQEPISEELVRQNKTVQVEYSSFVGIMLHRKLIEQIGLPDIGYYIYYDDFEYCYRFKNFTKILLNTNAHIYHMEDVSTRTLSKNDYYLIRNYLITLKNMETNNKLISAILFLLTRIKRLKRTNSLREIIPVFYKAIKDSFNYRSHFQK